MIRMNHSNKRSFKKRLLLLDVQRKLIGCRYVVSLLGSLLVASTDEQAKYLQNWAQVLSEAGAATDFLTHLEAVNMEPALATGCLTAAALCHDDLQIDARLTIDTLLQVKHLVVFLNICSYRPFG